LAAMDWKSEDETQVSPEELEQFNKLAVITENVVRQTKISPKQLMKLAKDGVIDIFSSEDKQRIVRDGYKPLCSLIKKYSDKYGATTTQREICENQMIEQFIAYQLIRFEVDHKTRDGKTPKLIQFAHQVARSIVYDKLFRSKEPSITDVPDHIQFMSGPGSEETSPHVEVVRQAVIRWMLAVNAGDEAK